MRWQKKSGCEEGFFASGCTVIRRQAMNRGEIGSVLAHPKAADKRQAKRGLENVDAEIQAKQV